MARTALAAAAAAVTALAALPAGAPAATVFRAAGTVYGGSTSQDDPLSLRMLPDRRRAAELRVHLSATCDDGQELVYSDGITFAAKAPTSIVEGRNVLVGDRLGATGRLTAKGVARVDYGTSVGAVTESLRATVRGSRATGRFSARIVLTDRTTGATNATCRTPSLSFTALSAPGRVFAGTTTQAEPVVVRLDAPGRTVTHLWIGRDATCASGASYSIGEDLQGFPLSSAGVFRTTFTNAAAQEDGGRQSSTYTVSGTVRGTRADGKLKVVETDTDPTGAASDSCSTPTVIWGATSSKLPGTGP